MTTRALVERVALIAPAALLLALGLASLGDAWGYVRLIGSRGPVVNATVAALAWAAFASLAAAGQRSSALTRRFGALLLVLLAVACAAAAFDTASRGYPLLSLRRLAGPLLALAACASVLGRVRARSYPDPGRDGGVSLLGAAAPPPALLPLALLGAAFGMNLPSGYEQTLAGLCLAMWLALWTSSLWASWSRSAREPWQIALHTADALELARAGGRLVPALAGGSRSQAARAVQALWAAACRNVVALGVGACVVAALIVTAGVWEPGVITNPDAARHLLRAKIVSELFLPQWRVDGWSPYWYLGAQLFLFQSYAYFALIGLFVHLLAPFAGLGTVVKAFFVLPVAALPVAAAWLAHRSGLGRAGVVATAAAALAIGSPTGYGVSGVFRTGLLLQGAGVIVFALAWPTVIDTAAGRRGSFARTAALVGIALCVHFITGAYLLVIGAAYAAVVSVSRREPAVLLRVGGALAAAVLLAGHALFPSLELHAMMGPAVGWGGADGRLIDVLTASAFEPHALALVAYLAALWVLLRDRRHVFVTAAIVMFVTLALSAAPLSATGNGLIGKLLYVVFKPRALPYACLLAALLVGFAAEQSVGRLAHARRGLKSWLLAAAAAALLAAGLVVTVSQIASSTRFVHTQAALKESDTALYNRLAGWLRSNVAPPALIAVDRSTFKFREIGAHSVISLLNVDTGLYTLSGDQVELTSATRRGGVVDPGDIAERGVDKSVDLLRRYGVSHVVITDPGTRAELAASPALELEYAYEELAVFSLDQGGQRLHGKAMAVADSDFQPERMRWRVVVAAPDGSTAIIAVSPHPNWSATVNGKPAALATTRDQLMKLELPRGFHTVELAWRRRPSEYWYAGVSLLTGLSILASLLRFRGRKR